MGTRVVDYEIVDHGIDWPDYFQGCGVAFTTFDECFTGIGDNAQAAYDDAVDCVAQSIDDVSALPETVDYLGTDEVDYEEYEEESPYYYVSIRVTVE
jgi:hypothetical protein